MVILATRYLPTCMPNCHFKAKSNAELSLQTKSKEARYLTYATTPSLLDKSEIYGFFSADAIERAFQILDQIPGRATGAYSHSQGIKGLRDAIAAGIEDRDGFPADPYDLFLTDGARPAVHMMMELLLRSEEDGILCPIHHHPLYSASIALYGGTLTLEDALNSLEGVTCNRAEGAMYLFPRINLPQKAIKAAKKAKKAPDAFYATRLLNATGVVVPGSGFRQVPGTWHFRCTILPHEKPAIASCLTEFHQKFMDEFCD